MSSGKTIGFRFKPSPLGPIPEDWEVVRLGEVASEIYYGITAKAVEHHTSLKILRTTDINNFSADWNSLPNCEITEKRTDLRRYLVRKNDILIARAGTVGVSVLSDKDFDNVVFGSYLIKVNLSEKVDPKFFHYFLQSKYYWHHLLKAQGSTLKNVNLPILKSLLIPLPPLPEQKRIAEVLRTVDEAILKVEQEIEHTERLKRGLMQHLLSRGIGHTRFKDSPIGKIPEEWDVVRVKDIGTVITGKTPSTKNDEFWNGDIMFVTPTDYKGKKYIEATERYVTKKGASQSTLIPPKSVLVVCIGSIGEIAINTKSCVTNQQINSIIPSEKIDSEFLYYTLKFKAKILKLWAGTTTTPIIKKSLFEKFTIPLPPLPEQKKIAEILMTVDRKLELLRQKKVHLERIKKGLMNDLLTGRRRLKVVNRK